MIEKILEFHCIALVCNDYEIVLRKGCNQKQNETNSRFRITEFSMTCKLQKSWYREKNSSDYNALLEGSTERDDYDSNRGLFVLT